MNQADKQYLDLLKHLLENGFSKSDRTGTGTVALFGYQMRFNLAEGFPLLTTKKIFFKAVVHELLWFLQGTGNIQYLKDNGVTIWDEWADENGDLGPVYGVQWRKWPAGGFDFRKPFPPIDQLANIISEIKKNPDSRRLVVSAWNAEALPRMALQPCHVLFQFVVIDGKLSCQLYQRSVDTFLGLPFNIASYALLTHMVAQVCNLEVGDFVWTGGDVHLYNNHMDQVKEQLSRTPFETLPTLKLNPAIKDIDDFKFEDIQIENYQCHPTIKADIAV